MEFVHLHCHSHYSLLDGLGRIDKLIATAKERNMKSLALTDHGSMYGVIDFYQACKKAGIKPIIGIETYLSDEPLEQEKPQSKPYHLVLLAKNKTGYKNLLKLTTVSHLEGFYYRPRIDWKSLEKYSEGLIALTACLNGPVSRPIRENNTNLATVNIKKLIDIFGSEDLYLELQYRPSIAEQSQVNQGLKKLSKEFAVPLVATNDCHYLVEGDAQAHDILLCLQTKSRLADKDRMSYIGEDYSLATAEIMSERFSDTPEAIANTVTIAERCNLELEFGKINLPQYDLPEGETADSHLRDLCLQGFPNRYNVTYEDASDELSNRLDYELDIIKKTGFAAYFLIVQDFANWAKNNGIIVGPGRGSAAGSIVSYLTNITNVDPIKYNLLFERFLNPERISMPDIDMDFADTRRDDVLRYVENKYGKDRVAQIITFGTMAARAAVRDVGRVMGLSYGYCDRIAKLIPMFTPLKEAIVKVKELKDVYSNDDEARQLIDNAMRLEGVARHVSTHACAVLITKEPLVEHVPLQYSTAHDEAIISQYSMHPVEDLGLLKMDFLGLKNLTILETAIEIIDKTVGKKISLDTIPLDDELTFKLFQRGETTGVFQLESSGMTRYLKLLQPSSIEDIIAMISLYRPGPMEFIDDYIDGKHGRKKITYIHPKLEPILNKTYGIAVYQEQIMEIARELAGLTYGQADILRKAVGKKIKKLLDEQEDLLIQGMVKNGIDKETAKTIWDFIIPFARYGFNRSHAASYAMIAYQTAYLKANFPAQFMAALMTADFHDIDKVARQVQECRKMAIEVLPPDINESFTIFTAVVDDPNKNPHRIRFGLSAIKNVGEHISKAIIHERKKNGKFTNLEDFLQRVTDKDLNKKSLDSLIKCGALDSFGSRATMLFNLETLLAFNKKVQQDSRLGQSNLFADLPLDQSHAKLKLEESPHSDHMQELAWEKELIGLYISDHPFSQYVEWLKDDTMSINNLLNREGQEVTVAGIITSLHKVVTKSGDPMLFALIEDSTGSMELIIFPKLFAHKGPLFEVGKLVIARGKVSEKDGSPKLVTDSIEELTSERLHHYQSKSSGRLKLWLNLPHGFTKEQLTKLKSIIEENNGAVPVYMIINNGHQRKIKTSYTIAVTNASKSAICNLIGDNNWSIEER